MAETATVETFGATLTRLLDGRKLPWLAGRSGLKYRTLQRIRADEQLPTFPEVVAIAGALDVPLDTFAPEAAEEASNG